MKKVLTHLLHAGGLEMGVEAANVIIDHKCNKALKCNKN